MRVMQLFIVLLGAGALAYWMTIEPKSDVATAAPMAALVEITVPETLSENAEIGKIAFEANCAACHGFNAVGQAGVAPPLVHKIYEPSHHGDESFQSAVAAGVRQHHWTFGDMSPVDGLTQGDVAMIIAYVRELQRANGIN